MKKDSNPINYIITDVLPAELPLIYSNKKLNLYLNQHISYLNDTTELGKSKRTIPISFKIRKSNTSFRKMSLMHPYMQVLSTKFIKDYTDILLIYFKQNKLFSIRTPISVNNTERIIEDKCYNEIMQMINPEAENYADDLKHIITNYYNLSRFPRLTDFYSSYFLKDLELKYGFLLKLDVKNCFESIYTHSVDWAYLGDKRIAKDNINNSKRFSSIIDKLMQNMNYGETNGILIGPEFSRVFAEIILTRLDNLVYESLTDKKIYYKKDYEIVRFIDDIFIFSISRDTALTIEEAIKSIYSEYKFTINEAKQYLETRPFMRQHLWVNNLKELLTNFTSFCDNSINEQKLSFGYNHFYDGIRDIIVQFEQQKSYIISYALSALEKLTDKFITIICLLSEPQKYFHASKYIDMICQTTSYGISYANIGKLCRIFLKLQHNCNEPKKYNLDELIYKKCYLLLNYNQDHIIELLNVIIILSFNTEKNLPSYLLESILEKDQNYLILSVITFYIQKIDQKNIYYHTLRKKINTIVEGILSNCCDYYGFNYSKSTNDDKLTESFILSDDMYILHDFYTSSIIDNTNKSNINKIKTFINSYYTNSINTAIRNSTNVDCPYIIFLGYIKDFDKPFMNWDANYNTIVLDIFLEKQKVKFIYE